MLFRAFRSVIERPFRANHGSNLDAQGIKKSVIERPFRANHGVTDDQQTVKGV